MTGQPAYDAVMDHPPAFLKRGLPRPARPLTWDDVRSLPIDLFWRYELFDGSLWVSSPERSMTWMDLEELPEHPQWRYELIDGTLIVSPNSPRLRHQLCAQELWRRLREVGPPELQAVMGPFEYVFGPENSFVPDVLVARRPIDEDRLKEAPVLVVEVLSPSTRHKDVVAKRDAYERAGVEHYWIVDPSGPDITVLALIDGVFRETGQFGPKERFSVVEPFPVEFDTIELTVD